MYNILSEIFRVAYGDLCYMKRNAVQTMVSSLVGPLLYLIAFGYGMRAGDSEYIAYVIPGIVAISSMNSGFSSSSQKIVIQRIFHSSFDELIICPMHTPSIILGKCVMGIVRGLVAGVIILCLGMFLTDGLFITAWLLLAMFLSSIMFSLLGVAAGLLANSTPTLMMFNSLLILPMSFMCGTLFDVDALPTVFSYIVWALPLSHTTSILRAAATCPGFEWMSDQVLSIVVTLIYLAVFYTICHVVIRKKLY
jgi:ABC-type multidrug transport system permease subunit